MAIFMVVLLFPIISTFFIKSENYVAYFKEKPIIPAIYWKPPFLGAAETNHDKHRLCGVKSEGMAKKKTTTSLSEKEIEKYRALLIEKWHEIVGSVVTMEENIFQGGGELSSMPVHMADVGTDSFEQEFGLDLLAEEKKILAEIQMALKRIDDGEFGICEGLGTPIEKKRLEAIPWTRYSLEYAQLLEKGQGGFKYRGVKSRPIDIDRDEEPEEEEEEETSPADGEDEEIELGDGMESLDALEEEEDDEDDDEREAV